MDIIVQFKGCLNKRALLVLKFSWVNFQHTVQGQIWHTVPNQIPFFTILLLHFNSQLTQPPVTTHPNEVSLKCPFICHIKQIIWSKIVFLQHALKKYIYIYFLFTFHIWEKPLTPRSSIYVLLRPWLSQHGNQVYLFCIAKQQILKQHLIFCWTDFWK